MNLKLVNWTFDNQSIVLRTDKTLHTLVRRIEEKHGNLDELSLYKGQVNAGNLFQAADVDATFADLGFEGAARREDAKTTNVYYDYKSIVESNPLLLVTPRTV